MINDISSSYLLISPETPNKSIINNKFLCDKTVNFLYSKGFSILSLSSFYEGNYDRSFIASYSDNDYLRETGIYLLEELHQDFLYIKYIGETEIKKLLNTGDEIPMKTTIYDSNTSLKTYIYEG